MYHVSAQGVDERMINVHYYYGAISGFACNGRATLENGAGIAQLVERLTEKLGAILTRVRVPGAAREFSPRVSFRCRLSYGVRAAPLCAIACINICVHVKNLKHGQPYHCLDTQIMHTLIGMGSAALAAAVPYPGKATRISCKGQRSTKQNRGIQC